MDSGYTLDEFPDALNAAAHRRRKARDRVALAQRRLEERIREASAAGMSARQIAKHTDLSFQRVSQILR